MPREMLAVPLALAMVLAAGHVVHAQPPTAPASSRAVPEAPGGHELLWPTRAPEGTLAHPILRRGHDMGLITAGIAGLSLGMVVGVAMASFDVAFGNCESFTGFGTVRVECGTAPFSLIPFAGSILVGSVAMHGSVRGEMILAGGLALAPQVLGIIFLLIGMHGATEDLVSNDDIALRFTPIVSSTEIGASWSLTL
jgi:hypothetical protein